MKFAKKLIIPIIVFSLIIQPVQFAFANESPPDGPDSKECCKQMERCLGVDLKCDEHPVSLMGGKLYFSLNDLIFGKKRKYTEVSQLYVRRFFSTQSSFMGVFGVGWTSNLDMRIVETGEGVTLRDEMGTLLYFVKTESGSLQSPSCVHSEMIRTQDGYLWKLKYGGEIFFEYVEKDGFSGYRLAWQKDRFGKTVRYEYSEEVSKKEIAQDIRRIYYYPVKIVQEFTGNYIEISYMKKTDRFGYENFYVTKIRDSEGREVKYGYQSIVTKDNEILYLSSVTDPLGQTLKYEFIVSENESGEKEIKAFKMTNKRGYSVTHYFNNPFEIPTHDSNWNWNLRVIKDVDALANETHYEFDTNLSLSIYTDKKGNQTIYKYSNMHIDEIIYPNGKTVKYSYDEARNKNGIINEYGHQTRYKFDDRGNKIEEIDALGNIAEWSYDEKYNLWTSYTDKRGNVWKREVKGKNIASETCPLGNTIHYEYDQYGNMISKTDALGNKFTYTYDSLGNMTSMTDPEGNVWHYEYNAFGDRIKTIDPEGNETIYEYDLLRRLIKITYPDGAQVEYKYDANDNLISEKSPSGKITTYEYDELDRKKAVHYPDGTTITYEYDPMGKLISENRPNGKYRYEYDEMGRRVGVILPDGSRISYNYDYDNEFNNGQYGGSMDQIKSITNPLGNTVKYAYDALGRKVINKDPLNNKKKYEYDPNGNLTKLIDELGNETKYYYDEANRLTKVENPLGETVEITYDAAGRKTSIKDRKGNITRYEYNRNGMVTKIIDANGGETQFTYDRNNNRTSVTDPEGNKTIYEYDKRGRLIRIIDPKGYEENYQYDIEGNLIKKIKADGTVIKYEYDVMNRLIRKILPEGVVKYTYDKAGNLISIEDLIGKREYKYDSMNRITEITYPGGYKVKYEYDLAGNRKKLIYPSGTEINYEYDKLNRLISLKVKKGEKEEEFTYAYDAKGRRTKLSYPNGLTTYYTYDKADRLLSIDTQKENTSIEKITYEYDANGNRTKREDSFGVHKYFYDSTNQLIKVEYPDKTLQEYTFDRIGNRIKLAETKNGKKELIKSYFNELNQITKKESSSYKGGEIISLFGTSDKEDLSKILINDIEGKIEDKFFTFEGIELKEGENKLTIKAIDKAGNIAEKELKLTLDNKALATYTYDTNGNLKSKTEKGLTWVYKWNSENKLIKAISSKGKIVEYGYYEGSLNNLAYRKENNKKEIYIYDGPHCIAKYDEKGNLINEYIYGPNIDEILSRIDADGKKYYYHQDGINSVIAIMNNSTKKVVSYLYDVYGKIRETKGSLKNEILFTGRWLDKSTNLYYYRARWYDADDGRFVSKDPIGFDSGDWNLYRYVGNGVVNAVDAFGNISGEWIKQPRLNITKIKIMKVNLESISFTKWGFLKFIRLFGKVEGFINIDVKCKCDDVIWEVHNRINIKVYGSIKVGINVYAVGTGLVVSKPAGIMVGISLITLKILDLEYKMLKKVKDKYGPIVRLIETKGPDAICYASWVKR